MEDPTDAARLKRINTKKAILFFIIDLLSDGGKSTSPEDIL